MLDLDRLHEIVITLRRNALRTLLTAVGVFWGVFLLVVMVGFGNGLREGAERSMGGLATNSLYLWGQRTSVPFGGRPPGRHVRLTLEDAEALRAIDGVQLVAPRATLGGRSASQAVSRGEAAGTFGVSGDVPGYARLQPMDLEGRFLNPLDMEERRKVAVIGRRVVEVLFADGTDPIGQTIQIKGIDFLVVGTFRSRQTGDRGANHDETVYVPLTTFQKALSASPFVDYMAVLSEPEVAVGDVEDQILRTVAARHRVAPTDQEALGSFNADAEYRKIVALFVGIRWLILVVGGATLTAGLVGVSNIMMVSVRERTREIGIRKAIGATPFAVVSQLVLEATFLASTAGYVGLVAAVAVLEAVGPLVAAGEATLFAPPHVALSTAIGAAVAVAFGGGLAGLFPALHAARIRCVDALREE